MCCTEVLISRNKIFNTFRNKCSKWYLEWEGVKINVIIAGTGGMKIYMIIPDPNTIIKASSGIITLFPCYQSPVFFTNMFFQNRE